MLLLDALHINNGGGLSLLQLLVKEMEAAKIDCYYLFDSRAENFFTHIPVNRKFISKPGVLNRLKFYLTHAGRFTTIFCFANMPPLLRLNKRTITYFQNVLLLGKGETGSAKTTILAFFKKVFFIISKNNTNVWLVQTDQTRDLFTTAFPNLKEKIKVYPFWDESFFCSKTNVGVKNNFLYVSDGHAHKNHLTLLKAWEELYNQGYTYSLTLTISYKNRPLCDKIKELQGKGMNIVNTGIVSKDDVKKLYSSHSVTIYPSLEESFGLGIIEAVSAGHSVIASNLPYVRSIVQASKYFNPHSPEDIAKAVLSFTHGREEQPTKLLVRNHLSDLINELNTPLNV